ncbi:MAG: UDP-glucose 4-epimerase GalE [Flavobacteriaceae bacterium]|nr:UDP-glucose 4-epimerase GalE [Flavobacteriaceae bacterium]
MTILVTGGLGYIGSHTVVSLNSNGFDTIIVDNLSNSKLSVLEKINSITGKENIFEKIDLCNTLEVESFFNKYSEIDGIIHFAALKSVSESTINPLKYYQNNVLSLINILNQAEKRDINNFIFSSSCTVYGEPDKLPIDENHRFKKATSPYGYTKQIGERIVKDLTLNNKKFKAISLRYFNPIGAHSSLLIGELPLGKPNNLVPMITQTMAGKFSFFEIYGSDYATKDGTCIRDYIHIMDLADAHVTGLLKLFNFKKSYYDVFNVGTGEGNSVLDIIKTFEKVNKVKLKYKFSKKRKGDVVSAYAETKKIRKELKWDHKCSIEEGLLSAWGWQCRLDKI